MNFKIVLGHRLVDASGGNGPDYTCCSVQQYKLFRETSLFCGVHQEMANAHPKSQSGASSLIASLSNLR